MSNNLIRTGIPTADLFGPGSGYGWNPFKGCDNKKCHLHPVNNGECWAAKMCNRMAGLWAKSEANFKTKKHPDAIMSSAVSIAVVKNNLKSFKPTRLESQYQKKLPEKRSCILVGYMTDIAFVPGEWVQKIIDKINANNEEREKAGLPLHVFQFLTKDPGCYHDFKFPLNCWLGFTATNQDEYDKRLLDIGDPFGAHYNGLNKIYAYLEPLRGPISIEASNSLPKWVIIGGQSGPKAKPMHQDWVRSIRDQCKAAGIPFYFKSWGKWLNYWCPHDHVYKYTKAPKGKLYNVLFGKTWEQFPEVE